MPAPTHMPAAVYRGPDQMVIETLPVPVIGPGELLVEVIACGVCGTDLKKIHGGLQSPPRVYGHETVGRIAQLGEGVAGWHEGQRVALYHHIPCGRCRYCRRGVPSQCPDYKRTGITAGFEPAGGGYARYVRVMDWIVAGGGVVPVPAGVSDLAATFVEPVNTCLKAMVRGDVQPGDTVWVIGAGPIGLLLMQAAGRAGARVVISDPLPGRLAVAVSLGAAAAVAPGDAAAAIGELSGGHGADAAFVAVAHSALAQTALEAVRPGGHVVLFAQTHLSDPVTLDAGQPGVLDKVILGAYSSDVSLNAAAAEAVFGGGIAVEPLVTDVLPLERIGEAIARASSPSDGSLKIVIQMA